MDSATFIAYAIVATLLTTALVMSALDAYESRNRDRNRDRRRVTALSLELMDARGERWAAHADAVAAEKAKEKAEADLVEAWRELFDQEQHLTAANTADVIDLRDRSRRS